MHSLLARQRARIVRFGAQLLQRDERFYRREYEWCEHAARTHIVQIHNAEAEALSRRLASAVPLGGGARALSERRATPTVAGGDGCDEEDEEFEEWEEWEEEAEEGEDATSPAALHPQAAAEARVQGDEGTERSDAASTTGFPPPDVAQLAVASRSLQFSVADGEARDFAHDVVSRAKATAFSQSPVPAL
jgi:hypothetical protein